WTAENATPIIEQHGSRRIREVEIAGDDIRFAVSVQITDSKRGGRRIDGSHRIVCSARETSESVAEQNGYGAITGVRGDEIRLAVGIEISPRDCCRKLPDTEFALWFEGDGGRYHVKTLIHRCRQFVVAIAGL